MRTALIFVCGSHRQNKYLWPTYYNSVAGIPHDIIVVHRNGQHIPDDMRNTSGGKIILEDKIFPEGELPHKAFGAYRHYFNKYKDEYDTFGFVSDDVLFKCDDWGKKSIDLLYKHEKIGWVATQIFNGLNNQYPHESHLRAPIWFAKSYALRQIDWQFGHDHEGEMNTADQFLAVGYFGLQVGNKINIAYDSTERHHFFEGDHITGMFEEQIMKHDREKKYTEEESKALNDFVLNMAKNPDVNKCIVPSPFSHIGDRNYIYDLEPFDRLIYDKGLELAKKYIEVENVLKHVYVMKGE